MKMNTKQRQILVTSALPYANGPIHIGHLVEYIQTDIWVRFQKMRGHVCHYVCADDAHGTPIMLRAEQEDISPERLIERIGREHRADFSAFSVAFDNFYSTHSPENRRLAERMYQTLNAAGHISRRTIKQAFDPVKKMFLPDRFIRGGCPSCGAADQYGDSCEACGATYSPTDLKNPLSALSGASPVTRESEHYFFRLDDFEAMLRVWTQGGRLQAEVSNKLDEWFEAGLREWDISRDAPYFGFEIPAAPGKYFYVWLDAPIGYLASFKHLCEARGLDFEAWTRADSETELYHFIGKDIIYFHALFWPAILHGSGFRTPTAIFAHGFLTVDGQKMSKTRGTFITARTYLEHLEPEYLRYYFAARLGPGIDDIDLNLDDFLLRVNADLVGKVVNIASRSAGFIERRFAGRLSSGHHDAALFNSLAGAAEDIAGAYERREYAEAMRAIMALADQTNQYIDAHKPWRIANPTAQQYITHKLAHAVLGCTLGQIGAGDCAAGAASGALGAAVAEGYERLTYAEFEAETSKLMKVAAEANGGELSAAQKVYYERLFLDWRRRGLDITKLSGALFAMAAGGEADTGALVAGNAAEHNIFPALFVIAKLGVAAYTAYEVYDTAQQAYAFYRRIEAGEEISDAETRRFARAIGMSLAQDVALSKLNVLKAAAVLVEKAGLDKKAGQLRAYISKNQKVDNNINAEEAGRIGKTTEGLDANANFAQNTFGKISGRKGKFSDLTIDDVAGALRSGNLKPSDVPIDFITRNGNTLILNTRSAQALIRVKIPRSKWTAVNRTGQKEYENRLNDQLRRNKLTDKGTPSVRPSKRKK